MMFLTTPLKNNVVTSKKGYNKIKSEHCGDLLELLDGKDYPVSIVIGEEMQPTEGHYHISNDEIYICLDGRITLKLYTPSTKTIEQIELNKYESIVIKKGVHHRIIGTDKGSKLITISIPGWSKEGDMLSEII